MEAEKTNFHNMQNDEHFEFFTHFLHLVNSAGVSKHHGSDKKKAASELFRGGFCIF